MKSCVVLWVALLLGGGHASCSRARRTPTASEAAAGGHSALAITLSFPAETAVNGEILVARLALRNVSSEAVWLNRRLVFNDQRAPPPLRDWWIHIASASALVSPDCPYNTPLPTDADYGVIQPGETLSTEQSVHCLNLLPGKYVLTARFWDGNENPPPPPAGVRWVNDGIESMPVSLEVLSADDPRAKMQ